MANDYISQIKVRGVTYDLSGGGGGGAVSSVNGQTGTVVLDAEDLQYDSSAAHTSGSVGKALSGKQDAPSVAGAAGQVLGLDSNLDPVWLAQSGGGGGSSYTYGQQVGSYNGRNLKELFGTAAALHAAISIGDFSNIRIGDYWPITPSGNYKDFAFYTVPSDITYYSDSGLTTSVGTTEAAYKGTYASATAVSFSLSGTTYYAAISDCTEGYSMSLSGTAKMEVAAINPYIRHGDTELTAPHVLFCSRDCLPNTMPYRVANGVWTDATQTNPWPGSALYKTLNDADDGVVKLVAATDLGAYLFAGPNSKGMRAFLPTMASGAGSPTSWAWADRGKLFLPTEREVYGAPVWGSAGGYEAGTLYNQWPIFAGSSRHIMKGSGDGGGRCYWWLETATTATNFALVDASGGADYSNAANTNIRVPLCFLVT